MLYYKRSDQADFLSTSNNELEKFIHGHLAVLKRLSINVSKTNYMLVTNRRINTDSAYNIDISNYRKTSVDSVTYFDVIFDSKLKYDRHIRNTSSKISKYL